MVGLGKKKQRSAPEPKLRMADDGRPQEGSRSTDDQFPIAAPGSGVRTKRCSSTRYLTPLCIDTPPPRDPRRAEKRAIYRAPRLKVIGEKRAGCGIDDMMNAKQHTTHNARSTRHGLHPLHLHAMFFVVWVVVFM